MQKNGLPQHCQLHRIIKDFLFRLATCWFFYHTLVLQPSVLFVSTELDQCNPRTIDFDCFLINRWHLFFEYLLRTNSFHIHIYFQVAPRGAWQHIIWTNKPIEFLEMKSQFTCLFILDSLEMKSQFRRTCQFGYKLIVLKLYMTIVNMPRNERINVCLYDWCKMCSMLML